MKTKQRYEKHKNCNKNYCEIEKNKPEGQAKVVSEHTPTPWYLVVNTPGVDIRHKFDGQELTLIENVNYQIANKIVRAVNEYDDLKKLGDASIKLAVDYEATWREKEKLKHSQQDLIDALGLAKATVERYAELGGFTTHSATFEVIDKAIKQAEGLEKQSGSAEGL